MHDFRESMCGVHFCRHDVKERRDPIKMIKSIVAQMAAHIPLYREQLMQAVDVIEANRDLTPVDLFEQALVQPLQRVNEDEVRQCISHTAYKHMSSDVNLTSIKPVKYVILIDALDESEDGGQNGIVDILAKQLDKMPAWIGNSTIL